MEVIKVNNITKDYGNNKGVFNVSFEVNRGEIVGFLGPNGAGKTTTIRHLMGFIKPDKGSVSIANMDCFREVDRVQEMLGYLPGEIAFMDDMTGNEFIRFVGEMKGIKDFSYAESLKEFFELDPRGKIKKMSKGMKQKIGIICAFMGDPEILILDEPTSGLDPLMQNKFVELVLEAKEKGKTILMSSHIFEEIEHTCNRVVIIKDGYIIADEDMESIKKTKNRIFNITFHSQDNANEFAAEYKESIVTKNTVKVSISSNVDGFIKSLAKYKVVDINVQSQSLEELFLHYYGGGK
ncbi:MAG: ABC transporter ATP-binding protein [Clostridium sp.]